MANTLRILSICIITLIAFIYGFNIFLTKQVNDLVYAPKGIDIHTFEQGQVNVVAAPWYNLVLSGQHLIYNNDIAYIVINVTADSVITTSASDLVLATLLAPINIIILLLLALAVSWLVSLRFKNKIENQRLDFLNNQFIELLSGLNIAINSHHTKRTQLEQLQNNFQSLSPNSDNKCTTHG